MRIRTVALALALACGITVMAEASPAKKPVVHKWTKKSSNRKSRMVAGRKVKTPKRIKVHKG
jgi:hypothetical protein